MSYKEIVIKFCNCHSTFDKWILTFNTAMKANTRCPECDNSLLKDIRYHMIIMSS